jgi:hypothetical protein
MKIFKLAASKILVLLSLSSCMQELSPSVNFRNVSTQKIYNIRGIWGRYYLSGENRLAPGGGASQNFAIDNKSDFFGPVHLEWENAVGKKFTKDFVFKREELPTYLLWDFQIEGLDREYHRNGANGVNKGYVRVEFYFDQDGVKYITSDNPDFERVHKQYHEQEEKNKRIFLGLDKK